MIDYIICGVRHATHILLGHKPGLFVFTETSIAYSGLGLEFVLNRTFGERTPLSYDPKVTLPTLKLGGLNHYDIGTANNTWAFNFMKGGMNGPMYLEILQENLIPSFGNRRFKRTMTPNMQPN